MYSTSIYLCLSLQRPSEDWSVSCRPPEENPDQRSVHETPRWRRPVSHRVGVAVARRSDTVWNLFTSVYTVREGAGCHLYTSSFLLSYTSVCCSWRFQPLLMFLNNSQTVAIYVSARPHLSLFLRSLDVSHDIWLFRLNFNRQLQEPATEKKQKKYPTTLWIFCLRVSNPLPCHAASARSQWLRSFFFFLTNLTLWSQDNTAWFFWFSGVFAMRINRSQIRLWGLCEQMFTWLDQKRGKRSEAVFLVTRPRAGLVISTMFLSSVLVKVVIIWIQTGANSLNGKFFFSSFCLFVFLILSSYWRVCTYYNMGYLFPICSFASSSANSIGQLIVTEAFCEFSMIIFLCLTHHWS